VEIEKKLEKFCELLVDPQIKGKQTAFDLCYQDLEQVKQYCSWNTIVDVIKKRTEISIKPVSASTMFRRAKEKRAKNHTHEVKNNNINREIKPTNITSCETEKDAQPDIDKEIKKWKSAGIESDFIINQCIENKVPLDVVLSWNTPNKIALNNKVTEYIMRNMNNRK